MSRPHFTLTVVTSRDGFIARHPGDSPASWASAEEQALFFADVEAADWGILGRHTHRVADRPDRRRIVFSTAAGQGDWRRPTQLWLDPGAVTPADLPARVGAVRPLTRGVILGGTRVHDWFLNHGAIDRVHLSVEPVGFGTGLPLFSAHQGPAETVLEDLGFAPIAERRLNASGTRHSIWTRRGT
ncbi:MAG: dihydrofolate reductase family protein [Alkalilacustris sp.]